MKRGLRALTLLLSLVLLFFAAPGARAEGAALRGYSAREGYEYVTLGEWEQTADGQRQPIVWRVLRVSDGRAYLCSEYVLMAHRMHENGKEYNSFDGEFAQTELCAYLNGEFAETAFTSAELSLLADWPPYGRLALLSAADLKDKSIGFGTDKARKAWGTEWAVEETGLFVYLRRYGSHSPYWVTDRSTSYKYGARCVKQSGSIGYINVITLNEGCRPACYLDLTLTQIGGGDGTLENPYQLLPADAL